MADAAGGAEVTLAELAASLGVRTPSLYNHVSGQTGLRRDLALLGTRELSARLGRAAVGKAADGAVLALANAYREFAGEHPGLYAATLRAPEPSDSELRAVGEEILAVLRAVLEAYGLRGDEATHAIRGLRSLLHGFVSLEVAGGFGLPLDLDESFTRLVRVFTAGLPLIDGESLARSLGTHSQTRDSGGPT
jgi:AcrR family transcriptional regulator